MIIDKLSKGKILPLNIEPKNGKGVLEKFGVEFLENPEDDKYKGEFQSVKLPHGWKIFPSPYERVNLREKYWGLYDDRGRMRAKIAFPKGTYRKKPFMSLQSRITVSRDVKLYLNNIVVYYIIVDQRVVCKTEAIRIENEEGAIAIIEDIENNIEKLLNKKYPDWRDPAAYWDEELTFGQYL